MYVLCVRAYINKIWVNFFQKCRVSPTDVFVASAQKAMLKPRMEVCAKLWSAGIRTEFSYKANPKMLNQLQYCEERKIPWVVIVGEEELKNGMVKLRNVKSREEMVCL